MHYHLIGIAGTAMASLAGLLRTSGHRVTGSDSGVYPPMSELLRDLGIDYADGYRPGNLRPRPDVVVVGNAISRGNPELEEVLDLGLRYTSAAAVIRSEFLEGRTCIAVAGTHGKTTTTAFLAWLLEAAGMNPGFLIGGVAENFGTSFRLTDGDIFVIEADEYDTAYFDKVPKMWHYRPRIAVLGNMEFDHADIYRDAEAYRWAFERFVNLVPANGALIAGWEAEGVRALATRSFAPVHSFAIGDELVPPPPPPDADRFPAQEAALAAPAGHPRWRAVDIDHGGEMTGFTVLLDGERWADVVMPVAGAFNVRNALAALAAATVAGAAREDLVEGLRGFRSVRRRLEVRGEPAGVLVVDDFAHHPTAVRETLTAARRRWPGRRLVAVFEPRSYTAQRKEFEAPYGQALALADEIVVGALFHPERYDAATGLDPHALVAEWRAHGKSAMHEPDVARIVAHLSATARAGDVVLIMSNGAFGGLHARLLEALSARA
jgi:UDP-N-acetylmuramate: L-alanyl-gamma-D-glutamyl-meso-diaminopimelate ligase